MNKNNTLKSYHTQQKAWSYFIYPAKHNNKTNIVKVKTIFDSFTERHKYIIECGDFLLFYGY